MLADVFPMRSPPRSSWKQISPLMTWIAKPSIPSDARHPYPPSFPGPSSAWNSPTEMQIGPPGSYTPLGVRNSNFGGFWGKSFVAVSLNMYSPPRNGASKPTARKCQTRGSVWSITGRRFGWPAIAFLYWTLRIFTTCGGAAMLCARAGPEAVSEQKDGFKSRAFQPRPPGPHPGPPRIAGSRAYFPLPTAVVDGLASFWAELREARWRAYPSTTVS